MDTNPEDLPKLDPVNRNADLTMTQGKIKGLQKNQLYHTLSAANLGEPNLAWKCIEAGRIFPSCFKANPHPQSKVVSDTSKVCVHFSTCLKLK